MRALVVGCGSIGRRHARNLCQLGVSVELTDVDEQRAEGLAAELGATARPRNSVTSADLVVVATPTAAHVDDLEWALELSEHVFVEKPLGATRRDLERTRCLALSTRKERVMVGCNLRFSDAFRALSAHMGDVGRVGAMLIEYGWWLPSWRPGEDYRQTYSAQRRLGGGIILDAIHEIDYALDLAGPVRDVVSRWTVTGLLDLDVEDVADITLSHSSGTQSHIHVDYLRHAYSRSCAVIGEHGTLLCDFANGRVEVTTDPGAKATLIAEGLDTDRNRQYVDELGCFIRANENGAMPVNGLDEATATLDVALSALELGQPS